MGCNLCVPHPVYWLVAAVAVPNSSRAVEPAIVLIRACFCLGIGLLATGCSVVGWELPNYGFYSFAPRADARQMQPGIVRELVRRVTLSDTTVVHEGELRLDTTRVNGERVWVLSRRTIDAAGRQVLDSAWLEDRTLRTISTVRYAPEGVTSQRFRRRSVDAEFVAAGTRRVRRHKLLYEAEPYGAIGIDLVVAALPMREGFGGKIPIVPGFGEPLYWMEFSVLDRRMEPVQRAGGIVFQPVWLVDIVSQGLKSRLWVDDATRTVLRRDESLSETERLLVSRGPEIPAVRLFPVEGLAVAAGTQRTIRRGQMMQVIPLPLPGESAAVPPVRPTPPGGGQ